MHAQLWSVIRSLFSPYLDSTIDKLLQFEKLTQSRGNSFLFSYFRWKFPTLHVSSSCHHHHRDYIANLLLPFDDSFRHPSNWLHGGGGERSGNYEITWGRERREGEHVVVNWESQQTTSFDDNWHMFNLWMALDEVRLVQLQTMESFSSHIEKQARKYDRKTFTLLSMNRLPINDDDETCAIFSPSPSSIIWEIVYRRLQRLSFRRCHPMLTLLRKVEKRLKKKKDENSSTS